MRDIATCGAKWRNASSALMESGLAGSSLPLSSEFDRIRLQSSCPILVTWHFCKCEDIGPVALTLLVTAAVTNCLLVVCHWFIFGGHPSDAISRMTFPMGALGTAMRGRA